MAIKTFTRGSSTYHCNVCNRLTRNTGDEGQSRLCFECYELAGIENEISDNGPLGDDSFTKPAYVVELLDRLKNKFGVDIRKAWGDTFASYLDQVK